MGKISKGVVAGALCLLGLVAGAPGSTKDVGYANANVGPVGEVDTAVPYSQPFTAVGDKFRPSFMLSLSDLEPALGVADYQYVRDDHAYAVEDFLHAWSGVKAAGLQPYRSSTPQSTATGDAPVFFPFGAGATASTSYGSKPVEGTYAESLPGSGSDSYNNGNNFGALMPSNENPYVDDLDILLPVVLSPADAGNTVPEPSSVALLALGLAGLAAILRRKRKCG